MYDYEARVIGHALSRNKLGNDKCIQDEIPLGSLIVSLHDFPKSVWKNYAFVHGAWHMITAVRTYGNPDDIRNLIEEIFFNADINKTTLDGVNFSDDMTVRWDNYTFSIIENGKVSDLVMNAQGWEERGADVKDVLRAGTPVVACLEAGWSPYECMSAIDRIQLDMIEEGLPDETLVAFRKTVSRWATDGIGKLITSGFEIDGDRDMHEYIPFAEGYYGKEWQPVRDADFAIMDFQLMALPLLTIIHMRTTVGLGMTNPDATKTGTRTIGKGEKIMLYAIGFGLAVIWLAGCLWLMFRLESGPSYNPMAVVLLPVGVFGALFIGIAFNACFEAKTATSISGVVTDVYEETLALSGTQTYASVKCEDRTYVLRLDNIDRRIIKEGDNIEGSVHAVGFDGSKMEGIIRTTTSNVAVTEDETTNE